jgi:tetratricopeptide (TPR) repeat protein
MTEDQIANFNSFYDKACKKMEGLIILEGYRPKTIGFFEKLKAKKAIEYFNSALSIYPEHFASLFFLGKLYQRLGDYETALAYFETALKFEKYNHNLPQEAALVAMHLNQIDKAIEYSAESLRRKPNDSALLGNHSMNLLIAGRDLEAKETIDRAITVEPTDQINQRIKEKIDGVISGKIHRPSFEESLR